MISSDRRRYIHVQCYIFKSLKLTKLFLKISEATESFSVVVVVVVVVDGALVVVVVVVCLSSQTHVDLYIFTLGL